MDTIKNHAVKITVATATVILVSVITFSFNIGAEFKTLETKDIYLTSKTDLYAERWEAVETRVSENEKSIDVHYTEIITLLEGMKEKLDKL